MAIATSTTQVNLLKRLYGNDIAKPMYEKSRLLADCKKDTKFRGENFTVAVKIGDTTGSSNTFADARAALNPSTIKKFLVTRRRTYALMQIENEVIEAGRGDGAIVDVLKNEMDAARNSFSEQMSRQVWGLDGGSWGRIDSSVNLASTSLKLRVRQDVIGGFRVGEVLEFASDNGTGLSPAGRRGAPDQLSVTAIDRDAGVMTTSAALNTVTNITVNDYVFPRGAYAAAFSGLPAWAPSTAPTAGSDSFFGLDRTVDTLRLSGIRVSGGGGDKEDTLQNAGAECLNNGIRPKKLYANPNDYSDLQKKLGSKVNVTKGEGYTGFKAVTAYTAAGEVDIVAEPYVPKGYAWMLDPEDFVLSTANECPAILSQGSGQYGMMLLDAQDAFELRLGTYGNFYHRNPGGTCVIAW